MESVNAIAYAAWCVMVLMGVWVCFKDADADKNDWVFEHVLLCSSLICIGIYPIARWFMPHNKKQPVKRKSAITQLGGNGTVMHVKSIDELFRCIDKFMGIECIPGKGFTSIVYNKTVHKNTEPKIDKTTPETPKPVKTEVIKLTKKNYPYLSKQLLADCNDIIRYQREVKA